MDLFADRLGNITIASGVIRMDFLRLKEIQKDKDGNHIEMEQAFRMVMPLDGVMQTIDVLEKMKAELLAQVKAQQELESKK